MRNKKNILIINHIKYFILFMFMWTYSFADQINFTADNIETNGENLIEAYGNIVIENNKGIKITGKNLEADKQNGIYTIENEVILEDEINRLLLQSNKVIFDQKKNIIKSIGLTEIESKNNFEVLTSNITFDRGNEIIYSDNKSEIIDLNLNSLSLSNFFISLQNSSLRAETGVLIDKDLNEFEIKNIYYDFSSKKILGKDVNVNNNNANNKEYLPRMKGRALSFDKDNLKIDKSVFTNCKKRDGCPPWLIKAEEIHHDKKNKTINYKNAWLEIYDLPVIYFPKFFHPDPTVKRQSGFLIPTFSQSNNSDSYFKLPYFFALSENTDFTFTPRIYNDDKAVYQGEYRHYTKNSKNIIDASIKNDNFLLLEDNSTNSHFFLDSTINTKNDLFDFSELKIQAQATSSDNYLKSYNLKSPLINSQTTLNSKILYEGISDNLDLLISAEVYEDLTKSKSSDRYEYIFPNFDLTREIETKLDGNLEINHKGYNKLYQTNINENVLINDLHFKSNDNISSLGTISNYELFFKNFNIDSNNSKNYKNNFESDISGIVQFHSKLPMEKKGQKFNSSLSPIVVAKFSPENTKNLRSDDALINYENIYSIKRIGSNETIEGGHSLTIGNEFSIYDKENDLREIFNFNIATSLRNEENKSLSKKSSLGQTTSNLVGKVGLTTNDFYEINYDFIADNNMDEFNYHKISSKFEINNFITTFEFLEENKDLGDDSYWANETSLKIDDNKDLKFKTRKNKKTDLTEYYNLIYRYKMDCLVAGIEYKKDYYKDIGLKPSEKIFFSITIMPFQSKVDLPGVKK